MKVDFIWVIEELSISLAKKEYSQKQPISVQSVLLSKKRFKTIDAAKKWITSHNFHAGKIDITTNYYRFRQFEPYECKKESFKTKEISSGISIILCHKK